LTQPPISRPIILYDQKRGGYKKVELGAK
jgi:hypothetical protein